MKFLRSDSVFVFLACFLCVALFLKPAFLTAAVVLFTLICLLDVHPRPAEKVRVHKLLFLPVLLFLEYLVWCLFSDNTQEAFIQVGRRLPLLLFPLCFIFTDKKLGDRAYQIILFSFVCSCLLCSLICYGFAIANMVEHQSITNPNSDHLSYYFSYMALTEPVGIDPLYLSLYCNLAVIVALESPFLKRTTIRYLIVVYLGLFIILIAAKIGLILLLIISTFWSLKGARRKVRSFALAFTLLSLLWVGVTQLGFLRDRLSMSTTFDYTEVNSGLWTSTTFRLAIWSCATEAIERNPLYGYGTADGQKALNSIYTERNFKRGILDGYNAHNEYLFTLLDLGAVGLITLLSMLFFPIAKAIRTKNSLTSAFLVIALLSFFVEVILIRQKGVTFFAFFYSLLLWRMNSEPQPSDPSLIHTSTLNND